MEDNKTDLQRIEQKLDQLAEKQSQSRPMVYPYGFEYKSKTQVAGLPFVHILVGYGSDPEHPKIVAKGVIAIGNIALGVLAIGGVAVGGLALGGLSLGIIALAGLALGLFSFGGVAIGYLAVGGLAIGYIAFGGLAVGHYAFGGDAIGKHIISSKVFDPEAAEFLRGKLGSAADSIIKSVHPQ